MRLTGTCHCGAIRVEVPDAPASLTNCNCSICRRLGALWAYYPRADITVHGHPEGTEDYVQGDRTLRTVRCRRCGCVTHWEPLERRADSRAGVNMRNFEPALLQGARLELLDGATTWECIAADELYDTTPRVHSAWHAAHPPPEPASFEQQVEWHRAHALACACRPVPPEIRAAIAARQGGA